MKHLFIYVSILIVFKQGKSDQTFGQFGCYSNNENQHLCKVLTEGTEEKFQKNVSRAIAFGIQWLRNTTHDDNMLSSDILQAINLAGYVHDGGICSSYIQKESEKLVDGLDEFDKISGGKLAHLLIGLKASCHGNIKINDVAKSLKRKMKRFPEGEFNNYFQYSLGMIALYAHGIPMSSIYRRILLKKLFIGKEKVKQFDKNHMDDTEAMALMALSTISEEVSPDHWGYKHSNRELDKAKKKEELLSNPPTNLITLTLMLQALSRTSKPLYLSTYCQQTVDWILQQQKPDGSFGGIKETTWAIIALTGRSILEIRNLKCPPKKSKLDQSQYDLFTKNYRESLAKYTEVKRDAEKNKANQILDIKITVAEMVTSNRQNVLTSQNIVVPGTSTALDALKIASKTDSCFQHDTKMTSWGLMLTKLCNMVQNHAKKAYWLYYVNGKSAKVGAGKYDVKNGDHIEFVFKQYS